MAKRLIPLFDRVLVQKIAQKTVSSGGVLLPEAAGASKLNSGKVIGVGPGKVSKNGNVIPVCVKEGDTVLLPEYGGTSVKLGEEEFHLFHDDDILGILKD